jgi:hypothetical protein
MSGDAPLNGLMFFTLIAGVVIGAGLLLAFLRSRHNREIAAVAVRGDGYSRRGEPSGVGAELGGLLALAVLAMSLLAFGYRSHPGTDTSAEPAGQPNNQLATERTNPESSKPYNPRNPAPDIRTAPTGSSTGQGADSGGRPENAPKQ